MMKIKRFCNIFIVTILCFASAFLISCQKLDYVSNDGENNTTISNELHNIPITTSDTSENDWDYYEKYLLERGLSDYSIRDDEVKKLLFINDIDKSLFSIDRSYFNGSMVESNVFLQYIAIWQEELAYSANKLKSVLNEKDRDVFEKSQEAWQVEIDNLKELEKSILSAGSNYGVLKGRAESAEGARRFYFKYRERTLEIKYLHFEIERTLNRDYKEHDYSTYESLKFKYRN